MQNLPSKLAGSKAPETRDSELLQDWVRYRREEEFNELVRRHLGLVQGIARRHLGSDQTEDVVQMVFAILDRRAPRLGEIRSLAAWLHRVTVLECRTVMRAQVRERRNQNAAMEINRLNQARDPLAEALPYLDEAILNLPGSDREVVLMRYSEGLAFKEITRLTGRSEVALRQQVSRAVSKLATLLGGRGVVIPAAALAAGLGVTLVGSGTASAAGVVATSALATSATMGKSGVATFTTFIMTTKKSFLIVSVIIAAAGVGVQRYHVTAMKTRNADLATLASAAADSRELIANTVLAKRTSMGAQGRRKKVHLLDHLKSGGISEFTLRKDLEGRSQEELETALHEAEKLSIDQSIRDILIESILFEIGNPLLTLQYSEGNPDRFPSSSNAMRSLAEKDPAAAAAWIDRMEAEGKFPDNKLDQGSGPKMVYEEALVGVLAGKDPDAAFARMLTLSEGQRTALCNHIFVDPGNVETAADLIRKFVPEPQRVATLAQQLTSYRTFDEVGALLTKAEATDAERAATVRQSIKILESPELVVANSRPVEATRAWILKEAPADAERISGEMLASRLTSGNYAQMVDLALSYQQASGKDDALTTLRDSSEMKKLIESSDEATRAEIRKRMAQSDASKP
jgi:RNA polymerase sigma-70 factor (ECF subfamily)